MIVSLGILLGAILGLLVLSAFFSGSETALTAVSKVRIKHLAENGDERAKIIERLISRRDYLISTLLLGNNLVNILASALATSVFISLFGDLGILIATIFMTSLVLIFADILPKVIALKYTDHWALISSYIVKPVVTILGPIANLARRIAFIFVKGNGDSPTRLVDAHDEIRGHIDLHHEEGEVKKRDKDMLGGILDLPEVTVEDIMIHRNSIMTVDAKTKVEEILSLMLNSPFTRVPVWENDPDNFIGILHIKDLIKATIKKENEIENFNIKDILVETWFIPETTSLKEQLKNFIEKKIHMALVVDEYGSLMGLVTLEDLIEEITGPIMDEHDVDDEILPEETNIIDIDGDTPIRDINRSYGWDLPDEESATLAGLIIHESQTIPKKGNIYSFYGFKFEILDRKRNQITSIRIQKEV